MMKINACLIEGVEMIISINLVGRADEEAFPPLQLSTQLFSSPDDVP